jgi:two-component system KDP operon response regulator KdpE
VRAYPNVLLIDGDRASRRLLRVVLEAEGYRIVEAETAESGLKEAVERKPDVIILELTLPDCDGVEVIQTLREWKSTPLLVLSEETEDQIKVAALDAGASDYLTKPFSNSELLARLRVLQRSWPNEPDGPMLIDGGLRINLATHQIQLNGRHVRLTRKEEALFYVLARYAGKVVTKAHLIRSVWGVRSEDRSPDLRVLIGHVRKKLGVYGGEILIRTVGSLGYSLALSVHSKAMLASAAS